MRRHFLLLVLFSYDLESFLTQQSNGSILVHQISSVNNSRAQNVGSRGSWLVLRFVPYMGMSARPPCSRFRSQAP